MLGDWLAWPVVIGLLVAIFFGPLLLKIGAGLVILFFIILLAAQSDHGSSTRIDGHTRS